MTRCHWLVLLCVLVVLCADRSSADGQDRKREDLFEPGFAELSKEIEATSKARRPTVIAWVVDESASLNETRERLGKKVEQLGKSIEKSVHVSSLVIGVADDATLLTERVVPLARTAEFLAKLEHNKSGKENLFAGVELAVEQMGTMNVHHRWVIIVTDERGDDDERLPEVVTKCADSDVRVFCLGSMSPFGKDQGYVDYTYPDGHSNRVPVDQGPETFRYQVLQLPPLNAEMPLISSGFGPYALTVLCQKTNGQFIAIQNSADVTFKSEVMSSYEPDYELGLLSREAVSKQFRKHPVRVAVISAAETTYSVKNRYRNALKRTFRATSERSLRVELTECQRHVAVLDYAAQAALQFLEAAEEHREAETDARWKAAYDLAFGQSLATKVRCYTLNLELARTKVKADLPKEPHNTWVLEPAEQTTSNVRMEEHAERATRYLNQVTKNYRGTPFAATAEVLLKSGYGWGWSLSQQTYPPEKKANPRRKTIPRRLTIIEEPRSEPKVIRRF